MSGVVKSIGKIFKKVGKIALKIAPYAIIAAAAIFAAPAVAGLLGIGATGAIGAGSVIGAGGAASAGGAMAAATGALGASATTGITGFLTNILGGGAGSSALGSLLSSSTAGSLLAGGARGLMANMQMKDEEKFLRDAENRRVERHTINDSSLFDFSGSSGSQGLGVTTADLTSPTTVVQNTALGRPPRQSVVELAQVTPPDRRFKYNHATGVIDFA